MCVYPKLINLFHKRTKVSVTNREWRLEFFVVSQFTADIFIVSTSGICGK